MLELTRETAVDILESGDEFVVDFDKAWQWLGYSTKGNAKRQFMNSDFEECSDYRLITLEKPVPQGGYTRIEEISLTIDCFKSWAMMAGTAQGKEVRKYFIQVEKEWKKQKLEVQYLKQEVTELKNLLSRDADHRPAHNAFLNWCRAYKFEVSRASKAVVKAATGREYDEVMSDTEQDSSDLKSGLWSVDVVTPEMVDSITRLKRSLSNSQRKKGETLEQVITRVAKRDKLVLA